MAATDLDYTQILVFGNMRSAVFYKTPQWRAARYLALTTHGNRCRLCGATPASGPLHVDHILPRSMHPDRCLDPTNLQVLCEPCHSAKGLVFTDDLRSKQTRIIRHMRDFLRIERYHLRLDARVPTNAEARALGDGIRAPHKAHRQRWRAFVRYCLVAKMTYSAARAVTVGDFLAAPPTKDHRYNKFLQNAGTGPKAANDLLFDIDGINFPVNIYSLLADDVRQSNDDFFLNAA